MGGPCTVDGQTRKELDNFHDCAIEADGMVWRSSEHYYQACKFPDDEEARKEISLAPTGMECWQRGQGFKDSLREDWEEVKVEMMYKANLAKYSQNQYLADVLTSSQGPIEARGGLFWKTWNEILLERIREELRDPADQDVEKLALRIKLMNDLRAAAAEGDTHKVEAVTMWAAKRKSVPEASAEVVKAVRVDGLDGVAWACGAVFQLDSMTPEVNGQPHYRSNTGAHLFLGTKRGRYAWCLDECFSPDEVGAEAFYEVAEDAAHDLPLGTQSWQVFGESRHADRDLTLRSAE